MKNSACTCEHESTARCAMHKKNGYRNPWKWDEEEHESWDDETYE